MIRKNTPNNTSKFMLTLCGIWPGASCVSLFRILWVILTGVSAFFHCRYFASHIYSAEIMDLMECLSTLIAHTKIMFKFFVFWFNQRKFVEILTDMAEDWSDSANSDISMRETLHKAKLSDRITNTIIILHTMSIITFCIGIFLTNVNVNDGIELPFATKIDIPFEIKTQSMYRIILLIEFLHLICCGWAAGITNSFLLTLVINFLPNDIFIFFQVLHTVGQIEITRHWLINLVSHENNHTSFIKTTSKIIEKHKKIINFSRNIESLYSIIALFQFVSNTIMICMLGFPIVTAIGSPNAVKQILKSFLFYTITNLEAFIFCYAGEYLHNKSKEIGIAAYDSEWYNLKFKESRVLLFIILRSQKQLSLTVGKMTDLSLETFTSIMNASGSYLSMLLAMQ
ncbi:odorant receptor 13a-like [Pogonomyrmex barbatus]|uniref:Odorant receptor n=1 Tax=Pogonomyrmex barbatus TaxID=144034 RepID=A0A8N1S2W3_9HYME|nr:odorant receptor 13a-like [Pogonomyrmex barbatus]